MSSSKVVLGIAVGAAVGAILGVLFAPDNGKSTRKKIASTSGDAVDKLKKKFSDFVDSVTAHVDGAKDDAEELVQSGKAKTNQLVGEVRNSF